MYSNDIMDSRNMEERIKEQEAEKERDEEDQDELDDLVELRSSQTTTAWRDGIAFIHENYFTEYAKDTAKSIYDIQDCWPFNLIDWEHAAEELKADYMEIEIQGEKYWYLAY